MIIEFGGFAKFNDPNQVVVGNCLFLLLKKSFASDTGSHLPFNLLNAL